MTFSATLRASTATAHARAEHAPFLAALAAGRVGRDGVVALLVRLQPVYAALERAAAAWSRDPVVGPFLLTSPRTGRIAADLARLDAAPGPAPAPARAYADRVAATADRRPAFLAHHYTRVLGDLAGGQVLLRVLERDADLAGALSFLDHDLVPQDALRHYRGLLDAAPLSEAERAELVAEALVAYDLNVALVADLA